MAPNTGGEEAPTASSVQAEQVVCITKQADGGYTVFSLKEDTETQDNLFQLQTTSLTEIPAELAAAPVVGQLPEYLQSSLTRNLHVLVSTKSGTGLALSFHNSVLKPLLTALGLSSSAAASGAASGWTYNEILTESTKSIQEFSAGLRNEQAGTANTVILLSGDGGIVEMLNGKAGGAEAEKAGSSPPLVAILPLGTGNALFNSLHKPVYQAHGDQAPSSLVVGLRTLLSGRAAPLPSFCAAFSDGSRTIKYSNESNGEGAGSGSGSDQAEEQSNKVTQLYGAIVASYGFHSQLVWESDTPEYRKHGDKRFGMVAGELLKESHAYAAEVEITTGEPPSARKLDRAQHAYILTTLVSNLEKTFTISPLSQPLDGKLRLVHFGAVGGQKTMEIMMKAYDEGKHVDMVWTNENGREEKVGYDEISEVTVTTQEEDPRWRKVCIDGTIVELSIGGSMTIRTEPTAHLQVLVHPTIHN